jgi:transglutaminase/protease-like cytokinesis protein 3
VKKQWQTIFAIFIWLCPFWADAQDFGKIDSFARSVQLNQMTVRELTDSLTKCYQSDLEKVRSIFVWIAHNIAYDYEKKDILESPDTMAYRSNPLFDDRILIKNVLERRKGICDDYSFLFRAMCQSAHIEVKVINGYAKTSYKEIGIAPTKTNHAWNAVRIDGHWHLLDVTWASERRYRGLSPEKLDEGYFLTSPSKLILNHLPEDEQWQLLETKVAKESFFHLPNVNSLYLKHKVQGFSPVNGIIQVDGQTMEIRLKIPQTERQIRLVEGDDVLDELVPVYEDGYYKFLFETSEEVEGDELSVAIQNDEGLFEVVVTYKLVRE